MKNAKHLCKRGLALLLALIMCAGMLSVSAGAMELQGTIAGKSLKQVDEVLEKLEKATPEEDLKEGPQEPSQDANGTDDQSNPPETPEDPEDPETPGKSLQDRLQEALNKVVENRTDENGNLELKTDEDLKPAEEVAQAKAAARSKRSGSSSVSLLSVDVPISDDIANCKCNECDCCGEVGEAWDGKTVCTCWYDSDTSAGNKYTIYTAAQLAGLAKLVNDDGVTFAKQTIKLGASIDLGGQNKQQWTPIGSCTRTTTPKESYVKKPFQGVFDGDENTISNLYIDKQCDVDGNEYADSSFIGLFGSTSGGEVKNFDLENATVKGYRGVAAICGFPGNTAYSGITLRGNVQITGGYQVGGMLGSQPKGALTDLEVSAASGSFVKATGTSEKDTFAKEEEKNRSSVGGIVGLLDANSGTLDGLKSNINVEGTGYGVGGIVGVAQYHATITGAECTAKEITYKATDGSENYGVGGIVGVWTQGNTGPVAITGCTFGEGGTLIANGVTLKDTHGLVGDIDPVNGTYVGTNIGLTIDNTVVVASIGNAWYTSLDEAIKAVEAGETLNVYAAEDGKVDGIPVGVTVVNKTGGETAITVNGQVIEQGEEYKAEAKVSIVRDGKVVAEYPTLQAAIDAAQEKDEVKLLDNVVPAEPVTVGQSITLDLGQYNITGPSQKTWRGSGEDGKHTNADAAIRVTGGTLTLTGTTGTITPSFTYGMSVESGAKAVINGGTIAAGDGEYGVYVRANGELTVNDGMISAGNNGAAITTNGNQTGQKITINGGTLKSGGEENPTGEDITLYLPYVEECIINGGDIKAWNTAIELRGGKLTVNGGNITATRTPTDAHEQGSGSTSKGAGIAVSPHNGKQLEVNISGGTIKGHTALYFVDKTTNGEDDEVVTASISGGAFEGNTAIAVKTGGIFTEASLKGCVTGGTFTDTSKPETSSVEKFISEDKNGLTETEDGTWTVVPAEGSVATVNGAGFPTFEEAVAAAKDNDTVVLLESVTLTQNPLVIRNAVSIEGDGYPTITGVIHYRIAKVEGQPNKQISLKGVKFDATGYANLTICFNGDNSTNGNSKYGADVTVTDCTFTQTGGCGIAVNSNAHAYNLTVEDCTFDVSTYAVDMKRDVNGLGYENTVIFGEGNKLINGKACQVFGKQSTEYVFPVNAEDFYADGKTHNLAVVRVNNGYGGSISVTSGYPEAVISLPDADPIRSGWTFTGWDWSCADEGCEGGHSNGAPVDHSVTITAQWTRNPTGTGGSRGGSSSTGGGNVEIVEDDVPLTEMPFLFIDIADGDWFYDAVKYVFTAGLMQGVGDDEFAPGSTTTRAMLMTILARMDGVDTDGGSSWYEKAMEWAVEQGVSDGSNPEGAITREQLATMLWRYLGQPEASGDAVSAFPDASSVSDWAQDAMIWAVENGIINGSDGKLNPQTGATRAEMATMLMRFCEKYVTLV